MEIVGDDQPVVVEKDGIDEGVDQHFAMSLLPYIQLTETMQPKGHEFRADTGFLQLFFFNFQLQIIPSRFQLIQPLLGGAR